MMMKEHSNSTPENQNSILKTAIDLTIKIGTLILILFFCFRILQPFVNILLWALIIAIIEYPIFLKAQGFFGKRRKLTAVILTLVLLAILLVPSYFLVNSLVDGLRNLAENFDKGSLQIPPPSESVAEWPVIGNWLYEKWMAASNNLSSILKEFLPQLGAFGEKLFNSIAGTGLGVLQFAASVIIAGIFLIWSDNASKSSRKFFDKLVGERGEEFSRISEQTIRNVATGVLGVALIQTILIGVALILTNVPLAGVWIILALVLIIAQLPVILITIPVIIYLFAFKEPFPAVLWTIYLILVGMLDNFLKPILMGKGSSIPMLVIFLGAIGGFIAFGFLGLFLGAIGLSLGYKLYQAWLEA